MADTYTVQGHCSNCGHSCSTTLPKGQPIQGIKQCPNCGCMTLQLQQWTQAIRQVPTLPVVPKRLPHVRLATPPLSESIRESLPDRAKPRPIFYDRNCQFDVDGSVMSAQ